jgi:hypothetical protein
MEGASCAGTTGGVNMAIMKESATTMPCLMGTLLFRRRIKRSFQAIKVELAMSREQFGPQSPMRYPRGKQLKEFGVCRLAIAESGHAWRHL